MEWDTAAADAIVREIGGICVDFETKDSLCYNKKALLNPWFICASQKCNTGIE